MSRRMDREGVPRHMMQLRRNEAVALRTKYDVRNWPIPWAVWQGWNAWNTACWYYRFRAVMPALGYKSFTKEQSEVRRFIRLYLAESRACQRPQLP